jgi:hypothetical protein
MRPSGLYENYDYSKGGGNERRINIHRDPQISIITKKLKREEII